MQKVVSVTATSDYFQPYPHISNYSKPSGTIRNNTEVSFLDYLKQYFQDSTVSSQTSASKSQAAGVLNWHYPLMMTLPKPVVRPKNDAEQS